MMHDPKLIEDMREAERRAWKAAKWGAPAKNPEWLGQVSAVLVLLCAARPDVAAVLAGDAVEVAVVNAQ